MVDGEMDAWEVAPPVEVDESGRMEGVVKGVVLEVDGVMGM